MTIERTFELLASALRRHVLSELLDGDGLSTIDDLAKSYATDRDVDDDRIIVELHHIHLPKLADYGVIEYDRRNGDVVLSETDAELEALLVASDGLRRPQSTSPS